MIESETIKAFKELKRNWDSYGAEPIGEKAIHEAQLIFNSLSALQIPKPVISPTTKGGIRFQWDNDNQVFSFELNSHGYAKDIFAFERFTK